MSEPCPDRDCSGHGSVTEGKCRCDDGYESEKCDRCASTHYEEEAVRGVLALISFSYSLTQRTHSSHTQPISLTRVTLLCPSLATISLECYGNTYLALRARTQVPSNHNRGYDKTRKICRRCAPFVTVNRADGHQYDEGATLEVSTSCDVAAQVVTSVGGSGAGLWAQRDKLKVKYADLFLSVEGSSDLTSSARVEIHEFSDNFPSGELQTDDARRWDTSTTRVRDGPDSFLPYAPISAGIDVVLALRLKSSDDTKIKWHRDDRVDLSDKAAKVMRHCSGSWDEAEVLDGMDQPQYSYRLIACSG